MEKRSQGILTFFILVSLSAACQSYDDKLKLLYRNAVPVIQSKELEQKIKQGQPVILLDTRTTEEFSVSHLPGATLIDYDHFKNDNVAGVDKEAEIVVYCTVGYRSERIGEKLKDLGFKNVHNLYGGIFQWVNEDGILLNEKNQPTDSVHTYSKRWATWLKKGVKVY